MEKSRDRITDLGYIYFEATRDGRITWVNRHFSGSLGYRPDQVVGQHFRRVLSGNHLRPFAAAFRAACESGGPQQLAAVALKDITGKQWIMDGTLASIRDNGVDEEMFACMLRDSAERTRTEEALIKAKQAAERELEIGREIQASFLPKQLPEIEGWQIASYFQVARMVSGDFYDAFMLNTTKKVGLVVADVCDKGVGAALFMGLFRSLIRAFADQPHSLSWMDVLSGDAGQERRGSGVGRRRSMLSAGTAALMSTIQQTNDYIAENHGDTSMFATMFLGMLDPGSGQLMYINAGQHPALLINPGGELQRLSSTGPAVGLMPDMSFRIETVTLQPGSLLLAYTDGLPDAMDAARRFFGQERIERIFSDGAETAEGMAEKLGASVREHMAGADQFDDVTFMVVKRGG